ncbi:MAG TPA: vitamin-B12 independent methionine synthase, partial [Acidimicrobiia bacterium]|nr:vitamin-B12 independent methionine synthase [Acidimicrobiia bacterium]
ELATPRAGEIDVFKEYGNQKEIGIGVVNPRSDRVEEPAEIVARVEQLLEWFDPEKIFLNPDCGFGTFAERPLNPPEIAAAKMRSIRVAAEQLRARHGG